MLLLFFHPKKGLFFSSSSSAILLAAARPAQAGGREGGGGQQEPSGTDSITTRLSLSERASSSPRPRLTAAEKGLSQRPLSFATARTDRPPHCQCRFLLSSLARARSWSRYWGKVEVLAGLPWVGGEGESVALAFHSPAPLVFLTFPRWRAHYRVRETLFSVIHTLSFLSSFPPVFFGLEVP